MRSICEGRLEGGRRGVHTLVEGDESGAVFTVYRHIGQHQRCIDGIVEQGHAPEGALHHSALVDEAHHLLGALRLIDIDHELMAAGRCLPVDGTELVAGDIVLNLLKLCIVARTAYALDAHIAQPVADGKQFVLAQLQVGGVDLDVGGGATTVAALHQSEHRGGKDADQAKPVDATLHGPQSVGDGGSAMGCHLEGKRHVATLEDKGYLVGHRQRHAEGITAGDVDVYLVVVAVGEALGAGSLGADGPPEPQSRSLGQYRQHQCQCEQPPQSVEGQPHVAHGGHYDHHAKHQVKAGGKKHAVDGYCGTSTLSINRRAT